MVSTLTETVRTDSNHRAWIRHAAILIPPAVRHRLLSRSTPQRRAGVVRSLKKRYLQLGATALALYMILHALEAIARNEGNRIPLGQIEAIEKPTPSTAILVTQRGVFKLGPSAFKVGTHVYLKPTVGSHATICSAGAAVAHCEILQ